MGGYRWLSGDKDVDGEVTEDKNQVPDREEAVRQGRRSARLSCCGDAASPRSLIGFGSIEVGQRYRDNRLVV